MGPEKGIHKSCPFKAAANVGNQEVGRSISPREMCTQSCGIYDEKEGACAFRVLAKVAQPLMLMLQGLGSASPAEKNLM